jgi:hypothetical protein
MERDQLTALWRLTVESDVINFRIEYFGEFEAEVVGNHKVGNLAALAV